MVANEKRPNVADRDGFAARLRQIVAAHGSTSTLARSLGRSDGALRKWLRGESEPNVSDLRALCELTGTSIEWLVTGRGSRFSPLAVRDTRPEVPTPAAPRSPFDYRLHDEVMATIDEEARALGIEIPRLKRSSMTGLLYERFLESRQVDREFVRRTVALTQVDALGPRDERGRSEAAERLAAAFKKLDALNLPPLSAEEVQAEIDAARAEQRSRDADRR
jgi:transcriptional regulator with XRE-family HTH domain